MSEDFDDFYAFDLPLDEDHLTVARQVRTFMTERSDQSSPQHRSRAGRIR